MRKTARSKSGRAREDYKKQRRITGIAYLKVDIRQPNCCHSLPLNVMGFPPQGEATEERPAGSVQQSQPPKAGARTFLSDIPVRRSVGAREG